jgi:prepilin-type N-terminal cleavage/methylation domain-containing protein
MAGRTTLKRGFTLVELLVVVAIMALLISIAVPSFQHVKIAAKNQAVRALINAAGAGLEMFQGDQKFGGTLPPSSSDLVSGPQAGKIRDPFRASGYARVTGASLLVYALAGPDNRGTAGFKATDSRWADSTGGPGSSTTSYLGIYDPNPPSSPPAPRADAFAGGDLLKSVKALGELDGAVEAGLDLKDAAQEVDASQRVFVDRFKMPLLYYRARKAATLMVTEPGTVNIGVYDHRDNALITGGELQDNSTRIGLCPVAKHFLNTTNYPNQARAVFCKPDAVIGTAEYNFDEYICDKSSGSDLTPSIQMRPVRANEYLLVSAGADRIYGTKDDINNWQ